MAEKAVILLSGGMDSAVSAAIARDIGYELTALHVNYRHRTEKRELEAFHNLADFYKIEERHVIDINYLSEIGASSLTDKKIDVSEANLNSREIPSSYVPFRNGNLLSIAVSFAEVNNSNAIVIGAVEQDSSGYPDCRPDFFKSMEKSINFGTKPETELKILTPVIEMSKKEIIKKGMELNVPFELTWSCYKESEKACGECDSCALRLRGFYQNGVEDPIPYIIRPEY